MTLAIVRDMSKAASNGIKSSSDHTQKCTTNNGTSLHTTNGSSNHNNGLSDSEHLSNGNGAGSKLSKVSPVFS